MTFTSCFSFLYFLSLSFSYTTPLHPKHYIICQILRPSALSLITQFSQISPSLKSIRFYNFPCKFFLHAFFLAFYLHFCLLTSFSSFLTAQFSHNLLLFHFKTFIHFFMTLLLLFITFSRVITSLHHPFKISTLFQNFQNYFSKIKSQTVLGFFIYIFTDHVTFTAPFNHSWLHKSRDLLRHSSISYVTQNHVTYCAIYSILYYVTPFYKL